MPSSRRGPADLEADLRDGLRRLRTPAPAPDFDARVLAGLRTPEPWWQTLWRAARPLLAGAACSFVVMLGMVAWTLQPSRPPHPVPTAPSTASPVRPLDMAAVDAILDRPNVCAASLWALAAPSAVPMPLHHRVVVRHRVKGMVSQVGMDMLA